MADLADSALPGMGAPAVSPAGALPGFALEPPAVPQKYAGAAAFYGVCEKTIKRWVKSGRDASDPCPYTDPPRMAPWWARVYQNRVPDCIDTAVKKLARPVPSPPPPNSQDPAALTSPASVPALPDAGIPLDLTQFDPSLFNYDATLMAARVVFMAQRQYYLNACARGDDPGTIRKAMQDFTEASENLRKLEKDSARIQEQAGQTMRVPALRNILIEIHGNVRKSLKMHLRHALASIPPDMNEAARNAWADSIIDDACKRLVESRFADPDKVKNAA